MRGHPRPDAAARIVDRVKLHRHTVRLDGDPYTVITLRPGTDARFSTNHFHNTWHVLTDLHGARLLGRLMWGLAYVRVPRTFVLIDPRFLDPNPFDAEPANPIALVPNPLTALRVRAAADLRRQLPLTSPVGTVRWHTPSLALAVEADHRERELLPGQWRSPWIPEYGFERIERVGGVVTFTASPRVWRRWAVVVFQLGRHAQRGMDYVDLHDWDGEIQVFTDYRRRVGAARVARREVLAEVPGVAPIELAPSIWDRTTQVRRRSREQAR